ncbi:MAG: TatD family hydrolase [Anaerolineales bacterium]|nr:TatD family hydrolase [Anaerolineales bacterium]
MRLVDSHCHLDSDRFDNDRQSVLERAWEAGLTHILIPAISPDSSKGVAKLAESHPGLYAAIGVHPNDAVTWRRTTPGVLRELAHNPKVVAIGEIGLDYYREYAPPDLQQEILLQQLELASELNLPVIIHLREAGDTRDDGPCTADLMRIITQWMAALVQQHHPLADNPGVLHSFSGTLETARHAINLGFYIGISGPVTFGNAHKRQEITASLPLESLLIETDAPFLSPHPYRGKRNQPAYVRLVAEQVSRLHNRTLQDTANTTSENADRLFRWGDIN